MELRERLLKELDRVARTISTGPNSNRYVVVGKCLGIIRCIGICEEEYGMKPPYGSLYAEEQGLVKDDALERELRASERGDEKSDGKLK
jgi:hypothetical protein